MMAEVSEVLPWPIKSVLAKYRELLALPRQSLLWGAAKSTAAAAAVVESDGLERIRSEMASHPSLSSSPNSAALRERLLLEAARRGYVYLVRELLCPPAESSPSSPPPVSMNVTDDQGNGLVHLAVMSGRFKIVRWLLKYFTQKQEEERGWNLLRHLAGSCNKKSETPFSLAICRGNMRVIFAFVNTVSEFDYSVIISDLGSYFGRLGIKELVEDFRGGNRPIRELRQRVIKYGDATSYDLEGQNTILSDNALSALASFSNRMLAALAILDARLEANDHVCMVIDRWARPIHLQQALIELSFEADKPNVMAKRLSLESMQTQFKGVFTPWWDTTLSSFDIKQYISERSDKESCAFFDLLDMAVGSGCVDTAMWLLMYWKAPPSLFSAKPANYYGEWYLRNADKIMETALIGWIRDKVFTVDEETPPHYNGAKEVILTTMGSRGCSSDPAHESSRINDFLWSVDLGEGHRFDPHLAWRKIHDQAPEANKDRKMWCSVPPKIFTAIKMACTLPLSDFEESEQAKLLGYFMETIYDEDPDFLSADLPSLAKFVVLDHLSFFQYLTKQRSSADETANQSSFLDLDMPLLCPVTNISASDEAGDRAMTDDEDNQCSICLEAMANPYKLRCGHSFHHRCLFWYVFPELRDGAAESSSTDNADALTHKVLSKVPNLSFTLGKTNCPYCRQSVKPSLQEAFALNLADGLMRTVSERRERPYSPHLDLTKFRTGITVGESLLAFAACSGAISIFQWLVSECGVKPNDVYAGDVNVMHHAIAHNQVLVVRWLCLNGHSSMLYGRLQRSAFDTFEPSLNSGTSMHDIELNLDDKNVAKRLQFWKRERGLAPLRSPDRDDYEYKEHELELVQELPSDEENQILGLQQVTEDQSPMHYLLMNSLKHFEGPISNFFFKFLRSLGVSAVPANWYQLVLSLSVDPTMRSDAKAFLSQEVLTPPQSKPCEQLPNIPPDEALSALDEVLARPVVEPLSPLVIARNPDQFNLWRMLCNGERDWRQFLQVASSLNVWDIYASKEWFEDHPLSNEYMRALVIAIIECGRVDVIAAFSTMEAFFCKYGRSRFDLFAVEADGGSFLRPTALALRPIIEERGKADVFAPLLARLDRVRDVRKSQSINNEVGRLIASGKGVEEIEAEINRRREEALELEGPEAPLGVGTREKVLIAFNISNINWLTDRWCGDKDVRLLFHTVVRRRDSNLIHWAFSLAMKHDDNIKEGDDFFFLWKASTAIVEAGELLALEAFVCFCIGGQGPSKYFEDRRLLMADLLNTERKQVHLPCTLIPGSTRTEGGGGILGNIFSRIFTLFASRSEGEDIKQTKAAIEKIYELARWVLDQPEMAAILASKAIRAKCLENILLADSSFIIKLYSLQLPHEMFRVLRLLLSYGFDLRGYVGGMDLISLILTWDATETWRDHILSADDRNELCSSDDYKDTSGTAVQSLHLLIRWLVFEVGISMQHLRYPDLASKGNGFFVKGLTLSEEEFDALKEEQRTKMTDEMEE